MPEVSPALSEKELIKRYDQESELISFHNVATFRPITDTGEQWYQSIKNSFKGESLDEIKTDMKDSFNRTLKKIPSEDATGDLLRLRSLEAMRVSQNLTYRDLGIKPADAKHIQDMTNDTLTQIAIEKFSGKSAFGSAAHNLETVSYCLKASGHNMDSDVTYKLLDPDMTKKKFDDMVGQAAKDAQSDMKQSANPASNSTYLNLSLS